jgi:hypothetical protein
LYPHTSNNALSDISDLVADDFPELHSEMCRTMLCTMSPTCCAMSSGATAWRFSYAIIPPCNSNVIAAAGCAVPSAVDVQPKSCRMQEW